MSLSGFLWKRTLEKDMTAVNFPLVDVDQAKAGPLLATEATDGGLDGCTQALKKAGAVIDATNPWSSLHRSKC